MSDKIRTDERTDGEVAVLSFAFVKQLGKFVRKGPRGPRGWDDSSVTSERNGGKSGLLLADIANGYLIPTINSVQSLLVSMRCYKNDKQQ